MTEDQDSLEQRRARGRRIIEEMLGEETAAETIAGWDAISPEFSGYVTEFLAGEIWSRDGLDRRTKSLVSIAALAALGETGVVEIVAVAGFYSMVALTLNAFQVDIPGGAPPPLAPLS